MQLSNESRLHQAEQLCQSQGARLTPLRKSLLQIIYSQNEQLSAYELLRLLRAVHSNAEAMTVYRSLDFLQKMGFIHKIATKNAYTACDMPQHRHASQLLLCEICGQAQEISAPELGIIFKKVLTSYQFKQSDKPLEITGICKSCQK